MSEQGVSAFLPTTHEEMKARGWRQADIVLVTGDAYVDHPSFGNAVIGRWLEAHGYKVCVLAQPRHDSPEAFRTFGRPRLFFGVSAGNLDSIVSNYSGNGRVRDHDDYSPDGDPYFGADRNRKERRRPDRATIVYSQLARAAYKGVPIVLGGLEASLRRFVHYDYQQEKLRASVLTDAKADLLVYGMGERAVLGVARRLEAGQALAGIPGTCERLSPAQLAERAIEGERVFLPSLTDLSSDVSKFLGAELTLEKHSRAGDEVSILQHQQAMWVLQNPPAENLSPAELDAVYELPYTGLPHPSAGDVPAWRMVRDSITTVRGCCGGCSFCAITRHQGAKVTSRSVDSVVREIRNLCRARHFAGTVRDLGGPTANLYGVLCAREAESPCKRRDCLYPRVCRHLDLNEQRMLDLLAAASKVEGVKHVYISSGLRMELLLKTPVLLARLLEHHTPGALKIAPEHTESHVLKLMHKGAGDLLERFLAEARKVSRRLGRHLHVTPYFMASHPGCSREDMEKLHAKARQLGLDVRQFQDFTPTPGTLSTAMYVSGIDRDTLRPIFVPRRRSERRIQREALESVSLRATHGDGSGGARKVPPTGDRKRSGGQWPKSPTKKGTPPR
jgi:uncharacterized radical SAM protein YgiQ